MFFATLVIALVMSTFVQSLPLRLRRELAQAETKAVSRSYDISFERRRGNSLVERSGATGSVSLGDNQDIIYTVPIQLGDTVMPVHLDTGSSDLWVISDACEDSACSLAPELNRYPIDSLNRSGVAVTLTYGDSKTGTFASGPVGTDTATLAGISMGDQQFGAINHTTNPTLQFGAVGIFGLGFPTGSVIQDGVVNHQFNTPDTNDAFLLSTPANGPLLSRMAISQDLEKPMFSISLQRDTVEIGGGNGVLSIGKLPDGVNDSDMTWVPVRLYTPDEGGVQPPAYAIDEVFPFRWEVEIDNVWLDGNILPPSTIPANGNVSSTKVSALIDTGNSILRGPSDVVQNILNSISTSGHADASSPPVIPCGVAHNLAFQIGGKMFPVDPANLIQPLEAGEADSCVANQIVSTDPPSVGALFRWSLGDTFLKSTTVAFYYGNLTHPSVDPPRIGFKSIVPGNAAQLLKQAVGAAKANHGDFSSTAQTVATTPVGFVTRVAQTVFAIPTAAAINPPAAVAAAPSGGNAALGQVTGVTSFTPQQTGSPLYTPLFSGSSAVMPSIWLSFLLVVLVVVLN